MARRVLLHACCAPCASVGLPALVNEGFSVSLYFYGGNIHPQIEWQARSDSLKKLAHEYNVPLRERPYSTEEWLSAAAGLEAEPEGGRRCVMCIRLQLEHAALYAAEEGIDTLCSSLTLSPMKDPQIINSLGAECAARHGLEWLERVWRKKNGVQKSVRECRRLSLYRQNYCGCVYSIAGKGNAEARSNGS